MEMTLAAAGHDAVADLGEGAQGKARWQNQEKNDGGVQRCWWLAGRREAEEDSSRGAGGRVYWWYAPMLYC